MLLYVIFSIIYSIPLILAFIQYRWRQFDKKHGFQGPKFWSILGSIPDLSRASRAKKTYSKIISYYDEFKTDTIRIRLGPMLMIFTKDLKILEEIANSPKFVKPDQYEFLKIWLGNSLVVSNGERWYKLRKLITPAFHFQSLESFIPIFEENAEVLVEKLGSIATEEAVNVLPVFQAFALDVVSESAMGVKLNSQNESNSNFVEATTRMLTLIHLRLMSPFYAQDWIWKCTSLYKEQLEVVRYIDEFMEDIIQHRTDEILNKNPFLEDRKRLCLMDILLKSEMNGKPLTKDDIRGEVNTFMFAGHETSGGTLSFIMYLLALNPECQTKILEELSVTGFYLSSPFDIRKLNFLPYLDGVIKESLRIYPIFPMIPKKCTEDVKIGEIILPKNTFIGTTFSVNHQDAKFFPNPEKFQPERWSNEFSNKNRNPYVFQPFSAGLRNCIGQKFAMLELKTAIIKIMEKFEVILGDKNYEPYLIVAFSLKTLNGIPLKFVPRKF